MEQSTRVSLFISPLRWLKRTLLCGLVAAAGFSGSAVALTLVEVTGPDPADSTQTIDEGEAGVISFVLDQPFSDVSITADEILCFCTGTVYLTTEIGTSASPFTSLVTAVDIEDETLSLSGLNLGAGTYYVVLYVETGFAIWPANLTPTVTEHADASQSLDYRTDAADASYPPSSDFDVIFGEGAMRYLVSVPDATTDGDGDGVADGVDNCPAIPNNDQANSDSDAEGDACDTDDDNDGVLDPSDNCPLTANAGQEDNDGDLAGDACDGDDDNDTVPDASDNCPFTANLPQTDTDVDGAGDACDEDIDGDGVPNAGDNCPDDPNALQENNDGDAAGDACDADDDNDSVPDAQDNCPMTGNADQADQDADNIGDACDADIDGDGTPNAGDNCPTDANPGQDDADLDGAGDACDTDDDNDGVPDDSDNCALMHNTDQSDTDGDGQGDVCDGDLDGDGYANGSDNCPDTANPSQHDQDGDGLGDVCDPDTDNDNVVNEDDLCPGTPPGEVASPDNGCTIAQLCPCEGPAGTTRPWNNHGKYVSCVARTSENFVEQGLISDAEKDAIVSTAGQSDCGAKR